MCTLPVHYTGVWCMYRLCRAKSTALVTVHGACGGIVDFIMQLSLFVCNLLPLTVYHHTKSVNHVGHRHTVQLSSLLDLYSRVSPLTAIIEELFQTGAAESTQTLRQSRGTDPALEVGPPLLLCPAPCPTPSSQEGLGGPSSEGGASSELKGHWTTPSHQRSTTLVENTHTTYSE